MGIITNSLGVEQIQGPYEGTTELERGLERADFGFMHYTKVPFDENGLVLGLNDVEFGAGTIILDVKYVVTTTASATAIDIGLTKVFADDTFTAVPNGLIDGAGAADAAGTIVGAGVQGTLVGDVLPVRTKLTMTSAHTAGAGFIIITSMGGDDYFDNINHGDKV